MFRPDPVGLSRIAPGNQKSSTSAGKCAWLVSDGIQTGFMHPPTAPRTLSSRIENIPAPAGGPDFYQSRLQPRSRPLLRATSRVPTLYQILAPDTVGSDDPIGSDAVYCIKLLSRTPLARRLRTRSLIRRSLS
jgi:hypothetical protein